MGKSIYIVALIATIAIFAVTFSVVKGFEDARLSQINEEIRQITLENELDKLYSEYYSSDTNNYCYFLNESISSSVERLEKLDYRLNAYRDSMISTDYAFIKKNFLITNMIMLSRVQRAITDCNLEITPIIYFYAEDKSCELECGAIANQLELIKQDCNSVWVFAFPYNWSEAKFTSILEKQYNVLKPGTLIINGEKLENLQQKEVLEEKISCKSN